MYICLLFIIDTDLFLVVVLQCVLVTFLQAPEGDVDLGRPPDLSAAKRHLGGVVEQPGVTWLLLIALHCLRHLVTHCGALAFQ